jgi:hypothetical protein
MLQPSNIVSKHMTFRQDCVPAGDMFYGELNLFVDHMISLEKMLNKTVSIPMLNKTVSTYTYLGFLLLYFLGQSATKTVSEG